MTILPQHIACRTYDMTPAEFGGYWMPGMNVSRMGVGAIPVSQSHV